MTISSQARISIGAKSRVQGRVPGPSLQGVSQLNESLGQLSLFYSLELKSGAR